MKAFKSALWILPLLLSFSAFADEYVGSSGKGGRVQEARKTRAIASQETPEQKTARTIQQCELVRDTVGGWLSMAIFSTNSPSRVAGPWRDNPTVTAKAQCNSQRGKYASKPYRCTCGTLAALQLAPTDEEIAWVFPKESANRNVKLAKD